MIWLQFRQALLPFQVFSTTDIEKIFPDFDSRRLVEWQRKGYIRKLINKWYLFSESLVDETLLFSISNCIYRPSYLSLESALAYYHLIPEGVYTQKAITTRKTIHYTTPVGVYDYHNIKPDLFFGYIVLHSSQRPVLMAEKEKAILDYLYNNASLQSQTDMEQVRFNYVELANNLDWEKLSKYKEVFANKTLDKRVNEFKILLKNAGIS